MPARIKSSFKSWVLLYVAFAIALIAAGPAEESSAATVSPGTYPSEIAADKVFFTPTIEQPRRNDI